MYVFVAMENLECKFEDDIEKTRIRGNTNKKQCIEQRQQQVPNEATNIIMLLIKY